MPHPLIEIILEGFVMLHLCEELSFKQLFPHKSNLLPRVALAPTLLACFIAYASNDPDFLYYHSQQLGAEQHSHRGWKIYALPYDDQVRPGALSTYSHHHVDEPWVISFKENAECYEPEEVGSAFYRSFRFIRRTGKPPTADGTLYLHIHRKEGVQLSKHLFLPQGYWAVEGPLSQDIRSWLNDRDFVFVRLSREDFLQAKAAPVPQANYHALEAA